MLAKVLDNSVLVLNRYYTAINVISARHAFTLLFKGAAEVISHDDEQLATYDIVSWIELSQLKTEFPEPYDEWARTPSLQICIPRIIRLNVYNKLPQKTVKFNRRNIFARDEGRCQYCSRRYPMSQLTLDHVKPKSLGGQTTWENVTTACVNCNTTKGGRRPEDAGMRLAKKPVKPKRSPLLKVKIRSEKYRSWRKFVSEIPTNGETNGTHALLNGHS